MSFYKEVIHIYIEMFQLVMDSKLVFKKKRFFNQPCFIAGDVIDFC